MRSPLVKGPLGQHRGIAWSVERIEGTLVIGHGGATFGQQALLWIAPEKRFALAMLTNSSRATQLQNAMTRWSWEHYLGVRRPRPSARAFTKQEAQRVTGTYQNTTTELRITLEDGKLTLHQRPRDDGWRKLMKEPPPIPAPVELSFAAPDRLLLLEGPLKDSQIELLAPPWVRFSSRLYRKVDA
jgi:hypothetical protein